MCDKSTVYLTYCACANRLYLLTAIPNCNSAAMATGLPSESARAKVAPPPVPTRGHSSHQASSQGVPAVQNVAWANGHAASSTASVSSTSHGIESRTGRSAQQSRSTSCSSSTACAHCSGIIIILEEFQCSRRHRYLSSSCCGSLFLSNPQHLQVQV